MGAAGVVALLLRRQPAVALLCATEQELARKCKGAIKFPCTSGLNLLGLRRDAWEHPRQLLASAPRLGRATHDGERSDEIDRPSS